MTFVIYLLCFQLYILSWSGFIFVNILCLRCSFMYHLFPYCVRISLNGYILVKGIDAFQWAKRSIFCQQIVLVSFLMKISNTLFVKQKKRENLIAPVFSITSVCNFYFNSYSNLYQMSMWPIINFNFNANGGQYKTYKGLHLNSIMQRNYE